MRKLALQAMALAAAVSCSPNPAPMGESAGTAVVVDDLFASFQASYPDGVQGWYTANRAPINALSEPDLKQLAGDIQPYYAEAMCTEDPVAGTANACALGCWPFGGTAFGDAMCTLLLGTWARCVTGIVGDWCETIP